MYNGTRFREQDRNEHVGEKLVLMWAEVSTGGGIEGDHLGFAHHRDKLVLEVNGERLYWRDADPGCGPQKLIPDVYTEVYWVCWLNPGSAPTILTRGTGLRSSSSLNMSSPPFPPSLRPWSLPIQTRATCG